MNRWFKIFFDPGASTAPIPLVFLSVAIVSMLQIPSYFLMMAGWVMPAITANELIAIAGVPLFLIYFLKYDRAKLLPFGYPGVYVIFLAIFFTVGVDIVIDYSTVATEYFLPVPDSIQESIKQLVAVSSAWDVVLKVVILCLLPGICEEIFFRGFCQTSLAARWGTLPAVIVSSLIFALLHGNPWYFHLYFLLGLFMGWAYATTGTLVAPIICHVLNNLWSVLRHYYRVEFPLYKSFGHVDLLLLVLGVMMCGVVIYLLYTHMKERRL